MPIDRDTLVEIAISTFAVGSFILGVIGIGLTFGNGGLGEEGGLALVVLIVGFILVMTGAGYWLSFRE